MTLTTTFDLLNQSNLSKRAIPQFHTLGLYRLGLMFAVIDCFDIYDLLESYVAIKYCYAIAVLAFMILYFLRWKDLYPSFAPIVFLLFFVLTGSAFAIRFFLFDERNSYITAFIAPLIFAAAIFVPSNALVFDARKVIRDLAIVLSIGTLLFFCEGLLKPLSLTSVQDIQFVKSMSSLLAVCLAVVCGNTVLVAIAGAASIATLAMRPSSTLVLALVTCLPIAAALRFRITHQRAAHFFVRIARLIAMITLAVAISAPLLLYFFFDDIAPAVDYWEEYLKSNIGGVSNVGFRLQILKLAFTSFDNTSFWYGSALSGSQAVPLGQAWAWWFSQSTSGEATIHSDFVIVLTLTGILGYVVFSAAFYSILRSRFRWLASRNLDGYAAVIHSISIVGCVALLVYSSDEPYLTYYSHTNLIWTLLFISEVARRSKITS